METIPLIVVKPKTLSLKEKTKLEKLGFIVVEHNDPDSFKYKLPTIEPSEQYVYTNCYTCGCRIYLLKEQLAALKNNYHTFYCYLGHNQAYVKPKTK